MNIRHILKGNRTFASNICQFSCFMEIPTEGTQHTNPDWAGLGRTKRFVEFNKMKYLVFFALFLALEVTYCSSHRAANEQVHHQERNARSPKNRGGECRYKKGPWEPCDPATNTEQRTLTLKRGDSTCEPTKVLSRKCKKACKYEKGDWNECDAATNTRTRTDTLKPKSDSSCEQTRTITKKCKKACRYDRQADWSRCDPSSGQKVKVLRLIQGDASVCEPNKIVKKPCGKKGKNKRVGDEYDEYE